MSSFGSNSRRSGGQSRPQQRSRMPSRRVASADEKKFLAGVAVDPHPHIILEQGSDDFQHGSRWKGSDRNVLVLQACMCEPHFVGR